MEKLFNNISKKILNCIKNDEHLKLSISGEKSQFIRFTQSKVRQSGIVEDASLSMSLIQNGKTCEATFTLTGNVEKDIEKALKELIYLRNEIHTLPKDPFVIIPENTGSSIENNTGVLLPYKNAVDSLIPSMKNVDLAGIWASGNIFIGNANSAGQKHWFSTDSFSLDYSLITPDERMVKGTYAGKKWDQNEYESNMFNSIEKLHMMEKTGKKIQPGKYRTYIAPAGVAEIVDMFSWGGIGEASIQQGDSSLCKMRNKNVKMSPCFSLREDFTSGMVPRFNYNGELAPEKMDLILSGSLTNTLISSRTAKEYNVKSNFASENESMRSPYISVGDLDENDVLSALDKGIYLSNLHYLNWSDRAGGRITGMTRYACFWVENGKIIAPIENMRFDDSIYNFFGENLEEMTNKAHFHPTVQTYDGRELGGVTCPGILLKSFDLTL